MASVAGMMEQAKAFLPDFVGRRKRGAEAIAPQHPVPELRLATSQSFLESSVPIAQLIENAVVPQVVEAHRAEIAEPRSALRLRKMAEEFAALAIDADAGELIAHLDDMLARGVDVGAILVDVLAPAARRLGEMWEQDDCDFVDVTMGLWRLQEVVRDLSGRVPPAIRARGGAFRAIFSAMPGEQHNFGTVIVEDVFRRAGWATSMVLDGQQAELLNAVARESVDLVGLTVSLDAHTERLPSLVLAIRSVSRNPRLCILLGGRVLMNDPQLAIRVGADGTAADAQSAVELADRLVTANACREVFTA